MVLFNNAATQLIIIIIIVSDNVNDCEALIMKHFIKRPARNSKYFCAIWNGTPGGGEGWRSHNGGFSVGGWNSCQGLHVLFSTEVGSLPKRAAEGVGWQRDIILWALHCAETVVVTAVVLHCWPCCLFSINPLVLVVLLNLYADAGFYLFIYFFPRVVRISFSLSCFCLAHT